MVKAGFCSIDITPPVGTPMAGFAARAGVSRGIHDGLRATAIAFEGAAAAVIVSADLIGIPAELVDAVRSQVERRTGIPGGAVMVATTHTHSGPALRPGFSGQGIASEHYIRTLVDDLAGAVCAAWESRRSAAIGSGSGTITGIGRNRRSADGLPVDPGVGVLRVLPDDGSPAAVLVNYACHPTVLGPDNLLISADYPGYARAFVEGCGGGDPHDQPGASRGIVAVFTNGAAGDVNAGHSADLSALGYPIPGRTFERARSLGTMLGCEARRVMETIEPAHDATVRVASTTVILAGKALPPMDEAQDDLRRKEKALEQATRAGAAEELLIKAKVAALYARLLVHRIGESESNEASDSARVAIQGIRIGDAAFLAVPVELFVNIGLAVKRRSTLGRAFVVGYANGDLGYLPSLQAFDEGGYEVVSSTFAPDSARAIEEGLVQLLALLT
jgi:neutral ceramidase